MSERMSRERFVNAFGMMMVNSESEEMLEILFTFAVEDALDAE